MARCFSTPAVHIVEVPISYEASIVLQVPAFCPASLPYPSNCKCICCMLLTLPYRWTHAFGPS
jgi:hypothetical protein